MVFREEKRKKKLTKTQIVVKKQRNLPGELKKQITQKSVKKPRGKEQNEKKKNKERSRKEI